MLNKKQIPSIKHFYPIVFGGKLPPHLGLDDRGRGGGVGDPDGAVFISSLYSDCEITKRMKMKLI